MFDRIFQIPQLGEVRYMSRIESMSKQNLVDTLWSVKKRKKIFFVKIKSLFWDSKRISSFINAIHETWNLNIRITNNVLDMPNEESEEEWMFAKSKNYWKGRREWIIHILSKLSSVRNWWLLKYFISLPWVDLDLQDWDGNTALHYSMIHGLRENVELLMLMWANKNIMNKEWNNILRLSTKLMRYNDVKYLLWYEDINLYINDPVTWKRKYLFTYIFEIYMSIENSDGYDKSFRFSDLNFFISQISDILYSKYFNHIAKEQWVKNTLTWEYEIDEDIVLDKLSREVGSHILLWSVKNITIKTLLIFSYNLFIDDHNMLYFILNINKTWNINLKDKHWNSLLHYIVRKHWVYNLIKLFLEFDGFDVNMLNNNWDSPFADVLSYGTVNEIWLFFHCKRVDKSILNPTTWDSIMNKALENFSLEKIKYVELQARSLGIDVLEHNKKWVNFLKKFMIKYINEWCESISADYKMLSNFIKYYFWLLLKDFFADNEWMAKFIDSINMAGRINLVDDKWFALIHYLAMVKWGSMFIEWLRDEYVFDPNIQEKKMNRTALHIAIEKWNIVFILRLISLSKLDINILWWKDNLPPIFTCLDLLNPQIAILLINTNKIDMTIKNTHSRTFFQELDYRISTTNKDSDLGKKLVSFKEELWAYKI